MALTMRRAELGDWARLFAWRNDPQTIAASKVAGPVGLLEHMKWLEATLARANVRLWVFVDDADAQCVGTGRADRRDEGTTELSLTVGPHARGRGLASLMVARMAAAAPLEFPGTRRLCADVKVDNYASLRAFAKCGFVPTTVHGGIAVLESTIAADERADARRSSRQGA